MEADNNLASALASEPINIGNWTFYPDKLYLECGEEEIKLEPRVAHLLHYLAENAGTPVSRVDLMEQVWSGMVVGDEALTGAINKLRNAFGDDRHHPEVIKTIPKVGYQLIANVEISTSENAIGKKDSPSRNQIAVIAFAIIVLFIAAGAYILLKPTEVHHESVSGGQMLNPMPDRPSIVVLPFTNMSADVEQEYFADGMTDDLITDLSKLSKLFVIARNSSFSYKGKNVDVREIAQELNIRYALEGSVRRSGGTIRINAQLIDTETGGHLWAERYDGTLENIFALQDEITQKIVSALAVELTRDERETLKRMDTDNLQAYEYFLEGRERFFRYSKDGMIEARDLFWRAIELDPDFARAYASLAWTYWFEFSNGWTHDPEGTLDRAETLATTAINLNNLLPVAYFVTALVYRERRDYVKAVVEAEKAIRLDPNYANGRVALATVLYYTGRAEEGLEQIREAMKLEPHSTHNYLWHLGQAYFILNRYEEAITAFEKGLLKNSTSERLRLWLAAAYAQTGQIDDASFELEEVLLSNPELTRSRIAGTYPFWYFGDLSSFMDALTKAGLE